MVWRMGKYTTIIISSLCYPECYNKINRSSIPVDFAGGVNIAGVLLITVGQLVGAAGERCTPAATLATVPLVLPKLAAQSIYFSKWQ